MSSRRVLKAAQAIREVVSMAILTDLKDPRIKNVTVTFVEVSADLRLAKVHVSVMDDENKQHLCLNGLKNSAGYLQQKVGRRIDTKYTPRLQFVLDKGVKNATLVTKILDEVLPKDKDESTADDSSDSADSVGNPESEGSPSLPPVESSDSRSEIDPEPMEN